jgi:hypothetical protein
MDLKELKSKTRAQAQRIIAGTSEPELIRQFSAHPNSHIKRYAAYKLDQLAGGQGVEMVRALRLVLSAVESGDFSVVTKAAKKLKRSEASKKAAATRKAKAA